MCGGRYHFNTKRDSSAPAVGPIIRGHGFEIYEFRVDRPTLLRGREIVDLNDDAGLWIYENKSNLIIAPR